MTREGCEGAELRAIGGVALAALLVVCLFLRRSLGGGAQRAGRAWELAHEAFNVCLFPPLFFFSGLYYTDVLSTLVVVVAYLAFQRGAGGESVGGGLVTYGLGLVGLVMRQTNIFWVGVFLAGMEWVRVCRDMAAKGANRGGEGNNGSWIERVLGPYTSGELHDPPLEEASPLGKSTINTRENVTNGLDWLYCLLSIGVSAISHPIILISRLWPQIVLLLSFGGFVAWNGGVVLGIPFNLPVATPGLTSNRRQVKPRRDPPYNANALPLALYSLLLLPPLPPHRGLSPVLQPPKTYPSRLDFPRHSAQPRHRPLQHSRPSLYPRRQSALHVLRLPVHDPAPPADKVRARADLRPLRLVRAACTQWPYATGNAEAGEAITHCNARRRRKARRGDKDVVCAHLAPHHSAISRYGASCRTAVLYSPVGNMAAACAA